ncbi:MAG: DUF342 domain-containing protein [Desulfohalobiaceae bacterium]
MPASQKDQELTGYLQLQGDPNYPVFAGQVFALLYPESGAHDPEAGREQTSSPDENNSLVQTVSSSCVYQAQSGKLIARGYGLVKIKEGRVHVVPLLRVSKDKLHLLATIYARDFFGQEITEQRIAQAVTNLGLEVELQEAQVQQALRQAAKQNAPQSKVVVARGGQLPQEAKDASLELAGDPALPVFPGFALGRLLREQECVPGKCIDGTSWEPEEKEPSRRITPGPKCGWELGQDQETMYATRYGLLSEHLGQPFVSPLIKISKDKLRVWATLYARDFYHKKISAQGIKELLLSAGLQAEIDEQAVAAALKQAKKDKAAQENVLVAQGKPPVSGRDSRLVFAWEQEQERVDDQDSLDPRQRSLFRSVDQEQLIGWLQPPGVGWPGKDVFGREVPSSPGSQVAVIVGDNVSAYKNGELLGGEEKPGDSAQPDADPGACARGSKGQQVAEPGAEFWSLAAGIVDWDGQTVSVQEAINVQGDVDYSTGNIDLQTGSVQIQGNIRAGFKVKTPDSVYVQQSVEGALVKAGKDCIVNAGLSMHEHGNVIVGGSLQAHFMENATVKARGDIIVSQDIVNSLVHTLGQVQATKGRGTIQGGLIRAAQGVQCKVLGSEHGVSTRVVLSFPAEGDPALVQRRDRLKQKLEQIQEELGEGNYQALLERTPKEKHPQLIEKLKAKTSINSELKEIKSRIKESRDALVQQALESKVVVKEVVYPGVEITIGQETLEVKETLRSPTFYLDQETMGIKIA